MSDCQEYAPLGGGGANSKKLAAKVASGSMTMQQASDYMRDQGWSLGSARSFQSAVADNQSTTPQGGAVRRGAAAADRVITRAGGTDPSGRVNQSLRRTAPRSSARGDSEMRANQRSSLRERAALNRDRRNAAGRPSGETRRGSAAAERVRERAGDAAPSGRVNRSLRNTGLSNPRVQPTAESFNASRQRRELRQQSRRRQRESAAATGRILLPLIERPQSNQ